MSSPRKRPFDSSSVFNDAADEGKSVPVSANAGESVESAPVKLKVSNPVSEEHTNPAPAPFTLARGRVYNYHTAINTLDPFRHLSDLSPNSLLYHTLSKLQNAYNDFETERNRALDSVFPLVTKLVHRACQSIDLTNFHEQLHLPAEQPGKPIQLIAKEMAFLESNRASPLPLPPSQAPNVNQTTPSRGILLRTYTQVEWQYLDTPEAWNNLHSASRYLINLDIPDVPQFFQGTVFSFEYSHTTTRRVLGSTGEPSWRIWMSFKAHYITTAEIRAATTVSHH